MFKRITIFLLFFAVPCHAGIRAIAGTEPGFWNDHAVVVGVVDKVMPRPTHDVHLEIRVKTIVITTRAIDTSVNLCADGFLNSEISALRADLHPGDLVIACVEAKDERWTLPSDGIGFMPNHGSAICVIPSPDDTFVRDTLDQVRRAFLSSVSKKEPK